jgi:signal transduction histidine kinase/AraC-like DNA-binding protein
VALAARVPDEAPAPRPAAGEISRTTLAARQACLAEMAAAAGWEVEKAAGGLEPLLEAFLREVEKGPDGRPPKGSEFLRGLEAVLDRSMHNQQDIALWQNAISVLRCWALPSLPPRARSWAEILLGQARVVVGEAAQRSQVYWQWQAERQADVQRETSQALLTSLDVAPLIDVLVEHLPLLGIPSAYLALYEASTGLETARLVLAWTDGSRLPLEPGGRRFPSRQVVPTDLLPRHRRYNLVVEPLYFQETPLGFAVFELGPHQGDVYELLRGNLSSALQGARLFQEAQQARLSAEKADRIKTRLLANVSHELRTPLNIILGYTQNIQRHPGLYTPDTRPGSAAETPGEAPVGPAASLPQVDPQGGPQAVPQAGLQGLPPGLLEDIRHIQNNAEHQLRVINDLLDLSRAEIDELDLALDLLDPQPILLEAFQNLADQSPAAAQVSWQLEVPDRLPQVRADAVRLRQIFLNLLSNARKFTERGQITLGAAVVPPELHFWVSDTGAGIPEEQRERIFEPFVTGEHSRGMARGASPGIGLGLTITRHLVALHNGRLKLESQPGQGSTFHIYLPLPALQAGRPFEQAETGPVLLLISSSPQPAQEIADLCQRQGLQIRRLDSRQLHNAEDLDRILAQARPAALAWDLADARPADWTLVRRLRHFPHITEAPFILYGQLSAEKPDGQPGAPHLSVGLTGFVVKSNQPQTLLEAVNAVCPVQAHDPVLVVDDDPQVLDAHQALLENCLPGCPILTAGDGLAALSILAKVVPALVVLDLVMPGMGGADVLDHIRSDPRLRQVPVIILSNKVMSQEDIKRLEQHARVSLQTKGIWTDSEASEAMHRAVLGGQSLPVYTSALVKRGLAYFHQNYARPLTRWEIAEAVGVSEDYLSRVFQRELGLSPWEYLNRYRILQARQLLANGSDSIGVIAHQVGFKDQAYFSRVFNKLTGQSPQAYRESRSGG